MTLGPGRCFGWERQGDGAVFGQRFALTSRERAEQ